MRHKGKLVLITGSTRGIGLATARRFAQEGAYVVLHGRTDSEVAEQALAEVKELGAEASFVAADLSKAEAGGNLADHVARTIGTIDIAIWNASLNMRKPFLDYEPEEFEPIYAMNFGGFAHFAHAVLPQMRYSLWGRVMATLSSAPYLYDSGFNLSGASKAGVISLIKHIAAEFARDGVTCNGVAPGLTRTETAEAFGLTERDVINEAIPARRIAEPEEIAGAFSYLASEEAGYITGQILHVNGGRYM
ncbi:MAG: SDR family NAD(P)-dependent oxidoreductase [Pseudomonadota bacterium]